VLPLLPKASALLAPAAFSPQKLALLECTHSTPCPLQPAPIEHVLPHPPSSDRCITPHLKRLK
jgi:hypothetical protein